MRRRRPQAVSSASSKTPGQPFAWLYRTSDVLAGLGILVAAWVLWRLVAGRRWAATGVALLAVTGASSALDAVTSMPCDPGTSAQCAQNEHTTFGLISQLLALHTDSGLLGFVGSAAGAAVVIAMAGRWPRWGRLQMRSDPRSGQLWPGRHRPAPAERQHRNDGTNPCPAHFRMFLIVGLFLAARARSVSALPADGR